MLNKSKGNMYEFITHTWNVIKGKCYHDCSYCYMKKFGEQREVRLDEKEFTTDLGKGNFIFIGSSTDMFAENIPDEWIFAVLEYIKKFPYNKYLFQTKNPRRILNKYKEMPSNAVICCTIESNMNIVNIMNNSPDIVDRVYSMIDLGEYFKTYITIEPIMKFDLYFLSSYIEDIKPEQVNIGADSGNNNLPEPNKEKVLELISKLEKFTKVIIKPNLKRIIGGSNEQ